jgi:hypothetical protein
MKLSQSVAIFESQRILVNFCNQLLERHMLVIVACLKFSQSLEDRYASILVSSSSIPDSILDLKNNARNGSVICTVTSD